MNETVNEEIRRRKEDMKAAADLVIAADEAEAGPSAEDMKTAALFAIAADTAETGSVGMQDNQAVPGPMETVGVMKTPNTSPASSHRCRDVVGELPVEDEQASGEAMSKQEDESTSRPEDNSMVHERSNHEVQSSSANEAFIPRPPVPNPEDSPGAHAIGGPVPHDDETTFIASSTVDEEMGETHQTIEAEAHLVDEAAERERLEQEIIQEAPRADVLVEKWQGRRSLLLWSGVLLLFGVLALALGLGVGLSNRSKRSYASLLSNMDECAGAFPVASVPFAHSGDIGKNTTVVESEALDCSTLDSQDHGHWFLIQGIDSCMTASATGNGFDAVLSVFQGDCNELSCVHTSDEIPTSKVYWSSTRRSYYVLITGASGSVGQYQLNIEVRLEFDSQLL